MRAIPLILTLVLSSAALAAGQRSEPRISVFVGATMRDGFVDADAGVIDSINDVQKALRNSRTLHLVSKRDDADLVVTILGRTIGPSGGAVGVPVGGVAVLLPINRRAIQWTMRAGNFEANRVSDDRDHDTWRSVADALVKDLAAWASANRLAIREPHPRR